MSNSEGVKGLKQLGQDLKAALLNKQNWRKAAGYLIEAAVILLATWYLSHMLMQDVEKHAQADTLEFFQKATAAMETTNGQLLMKYVISVLLPFLSITVIVVIWMIRMIQGIVKADREKQKNAQNLVIE